MNSQTKAILIDCEKREIREITLERDPSNGDHLQSFYGHIGNGCTLMENVCYVYSEDNTAHGLLVDEEGLFKQDNIKGGFYFHDNNALWQIVGNGVISAVNHMTGETIDVVLTAEQIKPRVRFFGEKEAQKYAREALGQDPIIINFDL